MKRALLFLILGITIQSHAYSEAELDNFLIENMNAIRLNAEKINELDKEIETIGNGIEILEPICEKRKVIRNYIALLENIENSKELMELIKEDTRFIEYKMYIKKTKENWQKYINRDDERLRKKLNVKPEMKVITLDYVCRAGGY
ncbi:hypothetical protein [Acinetobacter sp. YH12052]|uniref:hypothetical protein n=1 Tax=Acinetobacter sp. YH12052 TaxID=2601055 RepID=UPI0015D4080B|nr:hypothetical protein [Acinetobacter sp. YH12052]